MPGLEDFFEEILGLKDPEKLEALIATANEHGANASESYKLATAKVKALAEFIDRDQLPLYEALVHTLATIGHVMLFIKATEELR